MSAKRLICFGSLMALVVLAGCDAARLPVSFEVPVVLAQDLPLPDMGELPAGLPIPEGFGTFEVPWCTVPSEDAVMQMVEDAAGSLASKMLEIDNVKLIGLTVTAESGDFNTLKTMNLAWSSAVSGGDDFNLGSASAEAGLGNEVTITPEDDVDLLDLAAQEEGRPAGTCPDVIVDVTGTVPESLPVITITGMVRVEGTAGL